MLSAFSSQVRLHLKQNVLDRRSAERTAKASGLSSSLVGQRAVDVPSHPKLKPFRLPLGSGLKQGRYAYSVDKEHHTAHHYMTYGAIKAASVRRSNKSCGADMLVLAPLGKRDVASGQRAKLHGWS